MNWKEYIHSDSTVAAGKPVIKGTRLAVDFILGLLAEGWTQEQILENYPAIRKEALKAVFAYASESLQDEIIYEMPHRVA